MKAVCERRDITLDLDVLIPISAVLGIHQSLGVLHKTEGYVLAWLRRPHGALAVDGRPPIDLVASGTQDGLLTVFRFLDAVRGSFYMPPNEVDRNFRPYTDVDVVFP